MTPGKRLERADHIVADFVFALWRRESLGFMVGLARVRRSIVQ